MGDCCSSDAKKTVDPTALPEKKGYGRENSISQSSESNAHALVANEWREAVKSKDNKKLKKLFREHHKTVEFLQIKFENGDNSLHCAIKTNNNRLVKFLFLLKIQVNEQNENNGNTGLHYAVLDGNFDMVEMLLKNEDIKLDIRNQDNLTVMDIAQRQSNHQITRLFVKKIEENDSILNSNMTNKQGNVNEKKVQFDEEEQIHNHDPNISTIAPLPTSIPVVSRVNSTSSKRVSFGLPAFGNTASNNTHLTIQVVNNHNRQYSASGMSVASASHMSTGTMVVADDEHTMEKSHIDVSYIEHTHDDDYYTDEEHTLTGSRTNTSLRSPQSHHQDDYY